MSQVRAQRRRQWRLASVEAREQRVETARSTGACDADAERPAQMRITRRCVSSALHACVAALEAAHVLVGRVAHVGAEATAALEGERRSERVLEDVMNTKSSHTRRGPHHAAWLVRVCWRPLIRCAHHNRLLVR